MEKEEMMKLGMTLAILLLMLALVPSTSADAIIIDHTCTNISQIPDAWIEQAKEMFNVSYGHTSHGSQIVTGMDEIKNPTGSLYWWDHEGTQDGLSLHDSTPSGDLGNPDWYTWESRTRAMLDDSNNDRNMVMWSWCGQADTTPENMQIYLDLMSGLEADYLTVTFIYMTGHLTGSGEEGNLNQRNNQIRAHCIANNSVLFDFADIESYDPDGNYFLDKGATDSCSYNGGNWADEWCNAHLDSDLCISCSCAHSKPLNCNLKARALWWLMARLAGWNGTPKDDAIYVPDDYAKIQWAVDNATIDDTIIVRDGTYTENVNVNKRLTIRSENGAANCIVNAADPCDHVFEISVDSVIINGFTVRNATGNMINWKKAGIHVTNSDHVNISDCVVEHNVFGIRTTFSYYSDLTGNIVRDNTHGIYLASSPYATLTQNTLSNNSVRNLDTTGTNSYSYWHKHTIDTTNTVNGKPVYYYSDSNDLILENLDAGHISLVDCTNATVRGCSVIGGDEIRLVATDESIIDGNRVCDTEYAIWLLYSDNNIVRNNIANDNGGNGNGIRVQYGLDNWIENNTLKRNFIGIYVEGGSFSAELCKNNTIINNTIEDSELYGCGVFSTTHNWIINNTMRGSEHHGLYFQGHVSDNIMTGNRILDNGNSIWDYGILFPAQSSNNLIYNNYFGNTNNAQDGGTNIWNISSTFGMNIIGGSLLGGNYWSDYAGKDEDGDGLGDTMLPYNSSGGIVTGGDYLPLVSVSTVQFETELESGWNLISVPLNLTSWQLGAESVVGDPLNVTPKNCLTSIYRYDTTSAIFDKCDHFTGLGWWPATGSESFTELEPGRGYWVMAQNDCTLTFTGTAPSDLDIALNTSWNLIGWYSMGEALLGQEAVVGDPLNVTPKNSLSSIYRYNTSEGEFEKCDPFDNLGWWPATGSESFTRLEPGRGYWVMANSDCMWRHKA